MLLRRTTAGGASRAQMTSGRGAERPHRSAVPPNGSARVRDERHSFDPVGHCSRPDVFELRVHRRQLQASDFVD